MGTRTATKHIKVLNIGGHVSAHARHKLLAFDVGVEEAGLLYFWDGVGGSYLIGGQFVFPVLVFLLVVVRAR